ncbi:MAG: hypothetical protein EA350_11745 [Gemmatimonadales bacterium]|nr:MAG: hypothetical protein EA350_11745 [Gemmatimonadales bacterium]
MAEGASGALLSRPLPGVGPAVSDTFGDAAARDLMARARAARLRGIEGLESYQGRVWERIYIGLDGPAFRRERGLLQEERSGLVRWSAEGERRVLWEGARRDIPVAGVSSGRDEEMAQSLARELGGSRLPPPLTFDPGSDRILFGGSEWALNPLADTAGLHYRYSSGDTLRITLTEPDRQVVLAEIRVEPRRSEFRLLAASLWFDASTGALVRAVYRPARPFDLALDGDSGEGSDVPRLFRPVRAEIRVVSVDHGFFDFQWWIPRRFLFEGEASVGRLARFPLSVEWTLSDVDVNAPVPLELVGDDLPDGWVRTEVMVARPSREDSVPVIRIVPPGGTLATGPGISDATARERSTFTPGELRDLEGRLASLLPSPALGRVELFWGLEESLVRYNRIEGFAAGIGARTLLPGSREVRLRVRSATEAPLPTADLRVRGGTQGRRWEAEVYRRLVSSSEWHDATSLPSSLSNAFNGEGPTPWFRALGASAAVERGGAGQRWRLEAFGEAHSSAEFGTGAHLRRLIDEDRHLPANIVAEEGTWGGLRGDLRWQSGVDPLRPRAFSRLLAEAAGGASTFARGSVTGGLVFPLLPGWDGALELSAGGAAGALPRQRRFYPGGPSGYRPARVGEYEGDAFWLARAEVGRGFTGARGVVFVDALRVADSSLPPEAPGRGWVASPDLGAGVGLSFLDGLVRFDLSRQLRPEGGWRLQAYLDALF